MLQKKIKQFWVEQKWRKGENASFDTKELISTWASLIKSDTQKWLSTLMNNNFVEWFASNSLWLYWRIAPPPLSPTYDASFSKFWKLIQS